MNKKKLIEVLNIQSESYNQFRMFSYIIRQLKKIGCKYYTYNGCIYATKGETNLYPCIVSHMDTVHNIEENLTPIEVNGNIIGFNTVTMEQIGIGGDDKVGIFIALECLNNFDNIKAVFFRDEETGCEGSYSPDEYFFNDCNFILQCDRRGNSDFINVANEVELSSKKFQNDIKGILKSYNYTFTNGMMTDVMALKENGILCSMANISCGYYNPHSCNEYVNINDVEMCLNLVNSIIIKLYGIDYPCKYSPYIPPKKDKELTDWYNVGNKGLKIIDYDYWDIESKYRKKAETNCECCEEVGELEYIPEFNMDICEKCINQYVTYYKYQ